MERVTTSTGRRFASLLLTVCSLSVGACSTPTVVKGSESLDQRINSFLSALDLPSAEASELGTSLVEDSQLDELVSLNVFEPIPLREAAQLIAEQAGVSVITPADDGRLVAARFDSVRADQAFREIGRQSELEVEIDEGFVRFIDDGTARKSFATVAAGYEEAGLLANAIEAANAGKPIVSGTRIIVTGTPEQVERARELVEGSQGGRDGWMVEVAVVRVSEDLSSRIGIAANTTGAATGGLSLNLGTRGRPDNQATVGVDLVAQLLFDLAETHTDSQLLTTATLYVLEGGQGSIRQGDVVPVAQRTTSDQGTVTVTGFTFVETGFSLDVALRRVGGGRVVASMMPEVSTVTGFVADAPIVSTSNTTAEVVLEPGEWTMLSGLRDQSRISERAGAPGTRAPFGKSETRSESSDQLVLLVRGHRVSSSG